MNKLFILILMIIISVFFISSKSTAKANNYALLVGIEDYQYMDKLAGIRNDINKMTQFLIKHRNFPEKNIVTLKDKQATKQAIKDAFVNLKKITKSGDNIVFYFSGHGFQITDNNGDEVDGKDEALVPVDASYNGNTDPKVPYDAFLNMLKDDELKIWLDKLSDRKVEVIIDACYSGTITREYNNAQTNTPLALSKSPTTITSKKGNQTYRIKKSPPQDKTISNDFVQPTRNRKVWTAASATEVAFVDIEGKKPESVFTRAYLKGSINKKLADKNKDGTVTEAELLVYIRAESASFCYDMQQKGAGCGSLTPTFDLE